MWKTILKGGLTMSDKRDIYELLGDGVKRSPAEIIKALGLPSIHVSIHKFLKKAAGGSPNMSRVFPNIVHLPDDIEGARYNTDRFIRTR